MYCVIVSSTREARIGWKARALGRSKVAETRPQRSKIRTKETSSHKLNKMVGVGGLHGCMGMGRGRLSRQDARTTPQAC